MRYYKIVEQGYILCIGCADTKRQMPGEISQEEYDRLLGVIEAKPAAPEGYEYRLREDGSWELGQEEVD